MPRLSYPHHEMEFATYRSHHTPFYPNIAHHPSSSLLQRLGIEKLEFDANNLLQFQQFIHYSEPLELDTTIASSGPLDLSVKNSAPSLSSSSSSSLTQIPITPPCTPSPNKIKNSPQRSSTPDEEAPSNNKKFKFNNNNHSPSLAKKTKATRKLNFDEDNSSPVSGTIIRELRPDETLVVRKGDIDPAFNVVEITEEAKAELAKIENHIGDYVCRLCKELYEDAFGLAQHRCSRIVHVEYRCPECDKVFNCPANLASHRRWHKPRPNKESKLISTSSSSSITASEETRIVNLIESSDSVEQFSCNECGKRFRRIAYLRKHQTLHQMD